MRTLLCTLLPGLLLAGCADEGEGSVVVVAYGESYIEDGIPASAVDDGWSLDYERFEVTIRDIQVAGVELPDPGPVDLTEPSDGQGQELGSAMVAAGDHGDASFTIAHIEVDGAAHLDADTRTFAWVFDAPTHYDRCETTTKVPDGGEGQFQITIHGDHLLYDSLVSHDPLVQFQAFADADLDDDGEITMAELVARDIGSYDPGSEGGVDDLWAWLIALSRTVGHVDGEGHCHAAPE